MHAIRLIVLKKEEYEIQVQSKIELMDTKEEYYEEESVSKVDEKMDDGLEETP